MTTTVSRMQDSTCLWQSLLGLLGHGIPFHIGTLASARVLRCGCFFLCWAGSTELDSAPPSVLQVTPPKYPGHMAGFSARCIRSERLFQFQRSVGQTSSWSQPHGISRGYSRHLLACRPMACQAPQPHSVDRAASFLLPEQTRPPQYFLLAPRTETRYFGRQ